MLSISVRRWLMVPLVASATVLAVAAPASAKPIQFFEERAEAFWEVPHACADGSTAPGTLLVEHTATFEAPDTEDPIPTARPAVPRGLSRRDLLQLGRPSCTRDHHQQAASSGTSPLPAPERLVTSSASPTR